MLLNLSKSLEEEDLHNLAVRGLGMDTSIVDSALSNNPKNRNLAAYDVLKQWRNSQENASNAYNILCEAM